MLWAEHGRLEEIRQMMSNEALEKLTEKEEMIQKSLEQI